MEREQQQQQKSTLIEFTEVELLQLELLYWIACLHPEDLVEIPRKNRKRLKNHCVMSRYFDCYDLGIADAAQSVLNQAKEYYIGRSRRK